MSYSSFPVTAFRAQPYELNTWTVPGQFASIQDALASSSVKTGDRILITSNLSLSATVSVTKSVTIAGADNTIQITGTGSISLFSVASSATNVLFQNLRLTPSTSGTCISYPTAAGFNVYCSGCRFDGPVQLCSKGNLIRIVNCDFYKVENSIAQNRVPLLIGVDTENPSLSGPNKAIAITNCKFQDFTSNLSTAIRLDLVGTGCRTPIYVQGCSYLNATPSKALLQVVVGSTTTGSFLPVLVRDNNIGTGDILVQLTATDATSPALLDNFEYIHAYSNTISNASGYGLVTCDRSGSTPAQINLGSGAAAADTSNTISQPTTVKPGYTAGTVAGSRIVLTYQTAKFNSFSAPEYPDPRLSFEVPTFSPVGNGTIASGTKVLIPRVPWFASLSGLYVASSSGPWTNYRRASDLPGGSVVGSADLSGTLWVLESGTEDYFRRYLPTNDFGSGITGSTTISNNSSLAADSHYVDLTINSGVTLNTNGYRLYVSGLLKINPNGKISMDGASAVNQGGAIGHAGVGTLAIMSGSGGNGGSGSSTTPQPGAPGGGPANTTLHFPGVLTTTYEGGVGSAGHSVGTGGAAGTLPSATAIGGSFDNFIELYAGIPLKGIAFNGGGGGGGGGGGSAIANNGGGGGAGGGGVWIAARAIQNYGTISANGGNGANGSAAGGGTSGGGGAGGGGGWVTVIYGEGSPGLVTANGGSTGTGGTPSTVARAGRVTIRRIPG